MKHLADNFPTNQLTISHFADWSTHGLDDTWTSLCAEMFHGKLGLENRSKCDFNKFAVGGSTYVVRELHRLVWFTSCPVRKIVPLIRSRHMAL